MTNEQMLAFRVAEATYMADPFANARDISHAVSDKDEAQQMTARQSLSLFTHTPLSPLHILTEMYRHAEYFKIDNKIKV